MAAFAAANIVHRFRVSPHERLIFRDHTRCLPLVFALSVKRLFSLPIFTANLQRQVNLHRECSCAIAQRGPLKTKPMQL